MPALILLLSWWLLNIIGCQKTESGPIYQGRVEIIGICDNYTLSVLNGGLDTTQVAASWTDPTTNITYTNAFGLNNSCEFPDALRVGDTFSYRIVSNRNSNCVQCLAYYPIPPKTLTIQVVQP